MLNNINEDKLSESSKNILNINNIVNNNKSININLITNDHSQNSNYNTINNFNKLKKNQNLPSPSSNMNNINRRFSNQVEKPFQPNNFIQSGGIGAFFNNNNNNINNNNNDKYNNHNINSKNDKYDGEKDKDNDEDIEISRQLKKSSSVNANLRINNSKDLLPGGKIVLKGLNKMINSKMGMTSTIKTNTNEK